MVDSSRTPSSSIVPTPDFVGLKDRPIGVSILAILHLLGGVILLGMPFIMLANRQAMEGALRTIGIAPVVLIVGVVFLAVLAIASGIGMWRGAQWGWWLATFYYVYSILRNGSVLFMVASMGEELEASSHGSSYYIAKHGSRIAIHFLFFLYFFKGNVLAFFGLDSLNKLKAMGILVGICLALSFAFAIGNYYLR